MHLSGAARAAREMARGCLAGRKRRMRMDADAGELFRVLGWNERLELLAQAQGRYLDLLRDQGFDPDQSFTLVRDWSHQVWDWTVRSGPPAPVAAPFAPLPPGAGWSSHDQSVVA